MTKLRKQILLADHDELSRKLLGRVLRPRKDWEVCAEASDGPEAVRSAQALGPNLAIIDLTIAQTDGIETVRKIMEVCKDTAVLATSVYDPSLVVDQMIKAGIRGFVSKANIGSELIPAVEALFSGGTYFKLAKAHAG